MLTRLTVFQRASSWIRIHRGFTNDEKRKQNMRNGFLGATDTKASTKSEKSQLRRVFDIFDRDKDGYISAEDVKRTMKAYGKSKPDKDLSEMIEDARKKAVKRSALNFDQFETHLLSLNEHEETNAFTETARLLYSNEDFASRMLHLRDKEVSNNKYFPKQDLISLESLGFHL